MHERYEGGILQPPDANISRFVGRAMERSAAIVHRQLRQGLDSLATVASIAPLVGIFGALFGIANSFPGVAGQKGSMMWFTFARLSDACVPTALGLLVGVPSLWFYKYLTGRLECLDREMKNASLELVNLLIVCPVGLAPAARVKFVTESPIYRDEFGVELRQDRRPWYRSSLMVTTLLIVTWGVQIARYFDNYELPLEAVIWRAGVYIIFIFSVSCFAAYPAWLKLLNRTSGGLATMASLLCLGWSLAELFFHVHLL